MLTNGKKLKAKIYWQYCHNFIFQIIQDFISQDSDTYNFVCKTKFQMQLLKHVEICFSIIKLVQRKKIIK